MSWFLNGFLHSWGITATSIFGILGCIFLILAGRAHSLDECGRWATAAGLSFVCSIAAIPLYGMMNFWGFKYEVTIHNGKDSQAWPVDHYEFTDNGEVHFHKFDRCIITNNYSIRTRP